MMQPIEFRAPWSKPLRIVTAVTTAILLATSLLILLLSHKGTGLMLLIGVVPLLLLAIAIPCAVRGYVLTDQAIIVRRVGWRTRLPLSGLQSVSGDANAMRGSLRLLGNGGLFSFSGEFWNRRLGRYRALATDPSRAVVLRYPGRTIVITPHDPQQFIMRARTLLSTSQFR
jgi:hypothetical protein